MTLASAIHSLPSGFIFGTATSSYQIEGSSFGGCGQSHWDDFCRQDGRIANGDNGAVACAHYHHWASDLDLVADAGFNAYRFSFSWPRLLPEANQVTNPDGIDFYDRLIDGMLVRGLQPFATLYHWDLPSRLANDGGWQKRDITKYFADYTDIVMRRFGDRLETVAPINEPWCVAWLSHYWGHHAPGLTDLAATAKAMHHVQLAHGLSVSVMRDHGHKKIGAVLNKEFPQPIDDSALAIEKAGLFDGIYNRWFEDSIFKGCYPEEVLALFDGRMPDDFEGDMKLIATPLDWVGVNYYTRSVIKPDIRDPHIGFECVRGDLPKTDMGWEIYPEGLAYFLKRLSTDYCPNLPIYVTENGMANEDAVINGAVDDGSRTEFLAAHLEVVANLIAEGLPIQGYFAWSLLDNFEWAYGYDKRFGLVHVDYRTQKRTPKASWHAFRQSLRSG